MNEYHFYKARPVGKNEVESKVISFDQDVPNFTTLEQARLSYEQDAVAIEKVLFNVMPGGSYDQLLAAMLKRKASLFTVSHGAFDD